MGLLQPHIKTGGKSTTLQQKTRAAVQILVVGMLQHILDKYRDWPTGQALPIISRQQTGNLIKQVLREAGIAAPFVQVHYIGPVKHERIMPKWRPAPPTPPAPHLRGIIGQNKSGPIDHA